MDTAPKTDRTGLSRRSALKRAGAMAAGLAALEMTSLVSEIPERAYAASSPSDIQFDIGAFLTNPPQTSDTGVQFQMPPVHTMFLTARLQRTPTHADQTEMNRVLTV